MALIMTDLAYTLLARKAEQSVIERFGDAYLANRQRVPMFVPLKGKRREFFNRSGVPLKSA